MYEEINTKRLWLIVGIIAFLFSMILFYLLFIDTKVKSKEENEELVVTTTSVMVTATTEESGASGNSDVTAVITTIKTTTSTLDTTTTNATSLNHYRTDITFDGWVLYIDNAVYDASQKTLTFTMNQLNTRRNAQPIHINTIRRQQSSNDLKFFQVNTGVPNVPTKAAKVKIVVYDVDPDFRYVKINLKTLSVADDATDVTNGIWVYKDIAICSSDLNRL